MSDINSVKAPTSKVVCKFQPNDKILVVSVDDADAAPNQMQPLTDYFRQSGIPFTLLPHAGANKKVLNDMTNLKNHELGRHGIAAGVLDPTPPAGTNLNVIAWAAGRDDEGYKDTIAGNKNIVARGTQCLTQKIDQVDLHNLPSCSTHDGSDFSKQRDSVFKNGGFLSLHLHNGSGVQELKKTVGEFEAKGGKIVNLSDLKGCGKLKNE